MGPPSTCNWLTSNSVDYTGFSDTSRANIRMAHENGELTVSLQVSTPLINLVSFLTRSPPFRRPIDSRLRPQIDFSQPRNFP